MSHAMGLDKLHDVLVFESHKILAVTLPSDRGQRTLIGQLVHSAGADIQ